MCWHIFQKNLCFPTNISLLLSHLMTWANINVNTWLLLINRLHHPWPTNSTELVEPNIKKCISWALFIIMYRPTGRPCFFMKRDHCTKSFYDSSPKTVVGHGLFSATFYFLFLYFIAKARRRIPYSRNRFSCDISPIFIFVVASSTPPKE